MVGKKGYVRTVEVVVAILITFIFVMVIIPKYQTTGQEEDQVYVLSKLKYNEDFVECVLNEDEDCVEDMVKNEMPSRYTTKVLISKNVNAVISDIPLKRVHVDSAYFAGSVDKKGGYVVKVYYWTT